MVCMLCQPPFIRTLYQPGRVLGTQTRHTYQQQQRVSTTKSPNGHVTWTHNKTVLTIFVRTCTKKLCGARTHITPVVIREK